MSDELKAARERLFAVAFPGDPDTPIEVQDAIYSYREACLAEHPADDDEPITAEWLLTCGAVIERVREARSLNLPLHDMEAGVTFYQVIGPNQPLECKVENADGSGFWLQHIKTRGDVRRLCRALGVPLEEQ